MPELPEVETTRCGIEPHLMGRVILRILVRRGDLRVPVPEDLVRMAGGTFAEVRRRGKYLILMLADGRWILVHLGMSGSLRLAEVAEDWKVHDHLGVLFDDGKELRFHDPRRFGLVVTGVGDPMLHPLLASLGPEPLGRKFTAAYLRKQCVGKKVAIKVLLMNSKVVVGVGNIYASEALFRAGILPQNPAGDLVEARLAGLVRAIRRVLREAIQEGGTTLRDFLRSDGRPGYFRQKLMVYERAGQPCRICGTMIRHELQGQRSTYWCPNCQT